MNFAKRAIIFVLAASLTVTVVACHREGPAEKAGKKVDRAVADAKKLFKDVTSKD